MKKLFNRYSIIFLALTGYLILYRSLWRAGLPDFFASVPACLAVFLVLRFTGSELLLRRTEKKMTALNFFTFLGLIMLGQLLGHLTGTGISKLLASMGKPMTMAPDVEQARQLFADSSIAKLTTLFWPFLLGPIVEELLFRSYACANFEKEGGRNLAILLSAAAFSLSHGRFSFVVNTFVSALLYGYILFEYGVKWTCIFHVINNLGIVGLDVILCSILGTETGNLVNDLIAAALALFSVFVILKKRRETGEYIRSGRAGAGETAKALLNPGFLVFLAYCLYKCIVNTIPV